MNIPDVEIAFVGTPKGIENSLIPQAGYKLYHVEVEGIRRKISVENARALYLAFTSIGKAKKVIKEFGPDIVIGTGGYVCWPTLRAAASMGIPTMVHESNALPGVAVKQLQGKITLIVCVVHLKCTNGYVFLTHLSRPPYSICSAHRTCRRICRQGA